MMNRNSIAEKILCLYFNLEMQKECLPSLSKALYPTAGGTGGIHEGCRRIIQLILLMKGHKPFITKSKQAQYPLHNRKQNRSPFCLQFPYN